MLRLLADEDLDIRIVEGVLQKIDADILRAQNVGLSGRPDKQVLAWAADTQRVVLTHDSNTMTQAAYDRLRAGQPMPGLFVVRWDASIGEVVASLLVLIGAGKPQDWEGQVWYLPF
ncbi:MAG: DUF5615 family PIN-like protein [Chloroflexia bacterium]